MTVDDRSTLTAFGLSMAVALVAGAGFLGATLIAGDYGWVTRLGGAAWVCLLTLIIALPIVIPWKKKQA